MIQYNQEAGAQNMKSNLITTYLKMMKMLENTYLLPKHDMQVFLRSKPNILNNESALNNPYNERYINFAAS